MAEKDLFVISTVFCNPESDPVGVFHSVVPGLYDDKERALHDAESLIQALNRSKYSGTGTVERWRPEGCDGIVHEDGWIISVSTSENDEPYDRVLVNRVGAHLRDTKNETLAERIDELDRLAGRAHSV